MIAMREEKKTASITLQSANAFFFFLFAFISPFQYINDDKKGELFWEARWNRIPGTPVAFTLQKPKNPFYIYTRF